MIYALLSRNFVVEITHFFRKILGLGSRICKLFRFLDVWMTGANWSRSSPWDDSDDSSNVSTFAGLSWDFRSKRESRTTGSRVSQRRQIISSFPSSFCKTPLPHNTPLSQKSWTRRESRMESFTKETDWSSDWGRKCFLINAPQSSSLL